MTFLVSKIKSNCANISCETLRLIQKKEKIWLKEYRNTTLSHGEIM